MTVKVEKDVCSEDTTQSSETMDEKLPIAGPSSGSSTTRNSKHCIFLNGLIYQSTPTAWFCVCFALKIQYIQG